MTERDTGVVEETATKLAALRDDMRASIGRVEEQQLKAVLETGAEVIGGLRQAFVDYRESGEEAWKR